MEIVDRHGRCAVLYNLLIKSVDIFIVDASRVNALLNKDLENIFKVVNVRGVINKGV